MKPRRFFVGSLLLPAAVVLVFPTAANADVRIKQNNGTTVDLAGSWDALPGGSDIGQWTSVAGTTGNTVGVGAGLTLGAIQLTNPTGAVTLNSGSGTLTLNGTTVGGVSNVGIDMKSSTQNLTINAPLALGGSQQWNLANGRTLTIGGSTGFNQGANSLTLNGLGTVLFAPTFGTTANAAATGNVTVNGGTLDLSTGNTTGFPGLTNILGGSTPLVVGGGTVSTRVGNSVGTYTQNFNGLTINTGGSSFTQARGSSSLVVVNFGAISRNLGGTANLIPTTNNSGFRTSTVNTNGLTHAALTLNGTDFAQATNATTNISAASYVANTWAATNNTNVTASGSQAGATTNSLRFATAAGLTLTLSGTNTVSSGGLLNSSGVGASNNIITGGTLVGSATDLIIHQFASGNLTINSTIANNGTSSALTVTGTGTGSVLLGGANSFTGGIFINSAAKLSLTSGGSFNGNAVTFTNNSSGLLSLNGVNGTIGALNTSTVVANTTPLLQNANGTPAVLTIDSTAGGIYAGGIQNGSGGGSFGIVKTGSGTQTLSGINTYTGPTTISNGTLLVKSNINSSSSILVGGSGILDVTTSGLTIASGNTLSGTGSALGSIIAGAGANLTPHTLGTVGTLTIGALTLNSGSNLNFDLSGTSGVSDLLSVTGALTLGTGLNVNLAGAGAGLTGNSYTVFNYGTVSGFSPSNFSIASGGFGGLTYTFADTGSGAITLTIGGALAANGTWNQTVGGSWNSPATNWTPNSVPANSGDTANFGNSISAASTVTLDGNKTVGILNFNSSNAYTIAQGSGGSLILDNGASAANINDNSTPADPSQPGQVISAPVTMNSNTVVSVTPGETLAVTGAINGAGNLTKIGNGTLRLDSANSYAGSTSLNAGTLTFSNGALSNTAFNFGGGTLQYAAGNTEDLSGGRVVGFAGTAVIDTNGNDVVYNSTIGNSGTGGLLKQGLGSLTLASGNTYSGATTVAAGALKIMADSSLGAVPVSPATNLTINNGATLRIGVDLTLNANRNINFAGGTAVIDTNNFNATIAGTTTGSGLLNKTGAGILTLAGSSSATGGVTIDEGTIAVTSQANLPGGVLTLNNSGRITTVAPSSFSPVVNGTNSITSANTGNIQQLNVLSGNGTLTFGGGFVNDYTGNFSAFTGTLVGSGGGARWNGSTGGTNLTLDLGVTGISVRSAASGITIGAIAGSSTATISGGTGGQPQAVTYTIGGKTVGGLGVTPVNSTFDGSITNGGSTSVGLTKVGLSVLTLNGNSTYTGATTISAGALLVNGSLGNTAVAVNSGGTLGGSNGTIGTGTALVSVNNGGTLAPGNSPGSLTVNGSASLNSGSTYAYQYTGGLATADLLDVNGTLTLASGAILTLQELGTYTVGDKFTLFAYESLVGSFDVYQNNQAYTFNGGEWLFNYADATAGLNGGTVSGNAGSGFITITAVPEPASLLLGSLGLLALLRRRRN